MIEQEDDLQSYQIPFAKISQTATRSNTCQENDSIKWSPDDYADEDLFRSQDLFISQENANTYIRSPTNHQDHILQNKLGMRCGQTVVRNHHENDTFTTKTPWNYHEDLPHPKKLMNRKRSKKLLHIKEHQKDPTDKEGQEVKQHLKQLHVKHSRRKSDTQLIVKFPFLSKHSSSMTKPFESLNQSFSSECPGISDDSEDFAKKIVLEQETVSVSSWDEVETWIHKRWKSAGIQVKRLEE